MPSLKRLQLTDVIALGSALRAARTALQQPGRLDGAAERVMIWGHR